MWERLLFQHVRNINTVRSLKTCNIFYRIFMDTQCSSTFLIRQMFLKGGISRSHFFIWFFSSMLGLCLVGSHAEDSTCRLKTVQRVIIVLKNGTHLIFTTVQRKTPLGKKISCEPPLVFEGNVLFLVRIKLSGVFSLFFTYTLEQREKTAQCTLLFVFYERYAYNISGLIVKANSRLGACCFISIVWGLITWPCSAGTDRTRVLLKYWNGHSTYTKSQTAIQG